MNNDEKINKLIEITSSRDITALGEDNVDTIREFLEKWDAVEDDSQMDKKLDDLLDEYSNYLD